jgi:hypothetical protein
MTIAPSPLQSNAIRQRLTLAEYLAHDDGTGNRYEIVDGILVDMGTENKG